MTMIVSKRMSLDKPIMDLLPNFRDYDQEKLIKLQNAEFRTLDHFMSVVSELKQKEDTKCDVTYEEAIRQLRNHETALKQEDVEQIQNLVRSQLYARGLLTEEVYENYRYTTDGTQVDVDVGKYAAGEPDCVITPNRKYIDYFYELYISVSYPYYVTDDDVRRNVVKLLTTIEALQTKNIHIKVVLVFAAAHVEKGYPGSYFYSSIPVFSHKDTKHFDVMASVVNERLLRKFYFAILEDVYGENLADNYGIAVKLNGKLLNIGEEFNEIEFFQDILEAVHHESLQA